MYEFSLRRFRGNHSQSWWNFRCKLCLQNMIILSGYSICVVAFFDKVDYCFNICRNPIDAMIATDYNLWELHLNSLFSKWMIYILGCIILWCELMLYIIHVRFGTVPNIHTWLVESWLVCTKNVLFLMEFCENIDFNNVDIHSTTSPFILAVQVLSGLFWKTFIFPPNKWLNKTLFWWHFILIYSTNVYTIFSSSKMFTMVNQPAGALVFCTHISVLVWHF